MSAITNLGARSEAGMHQTKRKRRLRAISQYHWQVKHSRFSTDQRTLKIFGRHWKKSLKPRKRMTGMN